MGKFRDCLAGVDNFIDCLVGENISKFWEILEIFRLEKLRKTLEIVWQEKIWGNFNIVWWYKIWENLEIVWQELGNLDIVW